MNEEERELALNCYGYGRWDAPYWFIGPEQGLGKSEKKDDVDYEEVIRNRAKAIRKRAEAFRELDKDKDGLCDCCAFHIKIEDTSWHYKNEKEPHRKTPPLQSTWGFLILLLMEFQQKSTAPDNRREYQRKCWGSSNGETCVIELSGLPEKNFEESTARERARSEQENEEIERIRKERIEFIHQKILLYKPKFVVIYGKKQWDYWKEVADDIKKKGHTRIEFAKHPINRFKGQKKNQYFIALGKSLRTLGTS
jgi:hypothetical protein